MSFGQRTLLWTSWSAEPLNHHSPKGRFTDTLGTSVLLETAKAEDDRKEEGTREQGLILA